MSIKINRSKLQINCHGFLFADKIITINDISRLKTVKNKIVSKKHHLIISEIKIRLNKNNLFFIIIEGIYAIVISLSRYTSCIAWISSTPSFIGF